MIDRDDPFRGRSILDLEVFRVMAEDELDAVHRTSPDSPSIAGLERHLGELTTGIADLGHVGT
ncbi:MAG TPA: hypothetical protein VN969_37860 [Streptosporangiaceae bacterium]|nr:hypothetical protein [Streptosporangiaceae bacterium]